MRKTKPEIHNIEIRPVVGGYFVRAGCHERMYPDSKAGVAELVNDFAAYLKDPKAVQKEMGYPSPDMGAGTVSDGNAPMDAPLVGAPS